MQGTPRAIPLLPLRTPLQQASGAGGPIRSDAEAEANRSRINYMSPSLLSDEMIGSRHAYGPGLFDIPTAALLTGSFVAPASPSFSPFKYWQPQPLETQQQSQSAQAKGGGTLSHSQPLLYPQQLPTPNGPLLIKFTMQKEPLTNALHQQLGVSFTEKWDIGKMVLKEGEIVVEVLVKGFGFTNAQRVYKSVADPKQAEALLSYVQALEESSRVEAQNALANKITCALTSEMLVELGVRKALADQAVAEAGAAYQVCRVRWEEHDGSMLDLKKKLAAMQVTHEHFLLDSVRANKVLVAWNCSLLVPQVFECKSADLQPDEKLFDLSSLYPSDSVPHHAPRSRTSRALLDLLDLRVEGGVGGHALPPLFSHISPAFRAYQTSYESAQAAACLLPEHPDHSFTSCHHHQQFPRFEDLAIASGGGGGSHHASRVYLPIYLPSGANQAADASRQASHYTNYTPYLQSPNAPDAA